MRGQLELIGSFLLSFLMAITLLSSCSFSQKVYREPTDHLHSQPDVESIPGFQNTVQIISGVEYDKEEVQIAMFLFYDAWLTTFGDEDKTVLNSLLNLTIMWEPGVWQIKNVIAYDQNGEKHIKDIWASGLTQNKGFIRVAAHHKYIEDSSLIHELVHVALWNSDFSTKGDPDHEGPAHSGWTKQHSALIDIVNLTIARSRNIQ